MSTEDESKEITVGISDGKMIGNVIPRFRETLVGVGGYQWTNLDFEKYWSCVDGNTPIPKCFADESLSLAGVEKKVDTSWYKKNQTTKEELECQRQIVFARCQIERSFSFRIKTSSMGRTITAQSKTGYNNFTSFCSIRTKTISNFITFSVCISCTYNSN